MCPYKDQLREKDARIQELEKQIQNLERQVQLAKSDSKLYYDKMQTELQNGFDKDKVIADLQAKLSASDEKTSEPLLQPPPLERAAAQMPTTKITGVQCASVDDPVSQKNAPLSLPTAPIQPLTDQRSLADKSLNQIKEFFRDRSPEISEPLIVSDSESNDSDGESEIQFTLNQSKISSKEKAKRKKQAKAKERYKMLMDKALKRQEPWKCGTCSIFFRTAELLRQHNLVEHKEKKKFCNRCPHITNSQSELANHENMHSANDVKYKTATNGRECKLCHIWFGTNGHLLFHLRQFHLPKPSQ